MSAPGTTWSCLLHFTPVSKLRGCHKASLRCNSIIHCACRGLAGDCGLLGESQRSAGLPNASPVCLRVPMVISSRTGRNSAKSASRMHVLPGCGRHTVAHWCCRTRQGAATTAATHLGKSLIWLPAMQLSPCCHHFMSCCTSSDHVCVGDLLAPYLAFVSMLFPCCHYTMSCIAPEAPC